MATVLLVAVTLIAGAALFGYVNGQAANSENQIGVANAANVNFLNEKFVVVDIAVQTGAKSANVWVYNNGNLTLNIKQVVLYNGNKSNLYIIFNNAASSGSCGSASSPSHGSSSYIFGQGGTQITPRGNPLQITLNLPSGCVGLASGTTYYVNVLGLYGNDVISSSCDSPSGCNN